MHVRTQAAVAAVLAAASPASAQLNTLMKAAGKLYFGTATDNPQVQGSDTAYQAILGNTANFGIITPANTMKWQYTETGNGQFSYSQGDVIANFAESHGQMLRCHNLVWHAQLPNFSEFSFLSAMPGSFVHRPSVCDRSGLVR
jgi:endo-1,4-beta-xylanase